MKIIIMLDPNKNTYTYPRYSIDLIMSLTKNIDREKRLRVSANSYPYNQFSSD